MHEQSAFGIGKEFTLEKLLKRNRTMLTLSIVALGLYILLTVYGLISTSFAFGGINQVLLHDFVKSFFITVVLLIGYVAVFVLWSPDIYWHQRKRPTWQFVLLLVSVFGSLTTISVTTFIQMNINHMDAGSLVSSMEAYRMVSIYGSVVYYALIILQLVMIIILLAKCERKGKKILVFYLVTGVLSLINRAGYLLVWRLVSDSSLSSAWIDNMSGISFVVFLILNLLVLIFSIVYTSGKVKEARMPVEYRGY